MTIEADIDAALAGTGGVQCYHKAAPQAAVQPYTVYRAIEDEPLNVLSGYSGITRTDFLFESWAQTQAAANAQRDAVAAVLNAASLNSYQLPGGESAFDEQTNSHMAPCAFSFWHS